MKFRGGNALRIAFRAVQVGTGRTLVLVVGTLPQMGWCFAPVVPTSRPQMQNHRSRKAGR